MNSNYKIHLHLSFIIILDNNIDLQMVLFGLYGNLKNPGGLPQTCPYQLALVIAK